MGSFISLPGCRESYRGASLSLLLARLLSLFEVVNTKPAKKKNRERKPKPQCRPCEVCGWERVKIFW